MRDYNIESDLKQEKFEVIKLAQGDKGNKLTINVLEDGKPVSLTGCSITAKYKRADGQVINGSVTNISNNSFDAVIDSDITKVSGQLKMLFSIEKDGVKVSTFLLSAEVKEGIGESAGGSTGGGTGGGEVTVDLSNYYKKSETYSKSQIDSQLRDIANNFKLVAGANNAIKLMFGTKELSSITINGGTVDPTPTPNTYTVTNNLSNASTSNSATSVKEGTSYSATITASSGYRLKSVTVIMGGVDITSSVYSNGRISISDVTGNISITVTTEYITSEITTYTITNNLSHARNSNTATTIEEKSSYTATITADSNYRIKNVTVTMYGTDITNDVYSGGKIIIPRVIGNIVITVTTELISGGDEDLSKLDGILKDRLLVWHDEFDDATLDTTKWRYATHNSGGSEQQAYTVGRTENVRLENSNLILEARKDGYVDGWTWSSGRIDTSGLVGFRYGRLEAKLKYDVVSGAFPAFWTIGTCAHYPTGTDIHGVHKSKGTQWAQNGEIDMFEGRGTKSEIAQGGWYNQDDGKGNQTIIFGTKNIDASQYHVYAVEWTETTIIAYIDGVETGRKDISDIKSWHRPMYIILNMAVGSTGGYPTDDCTSMKMEVDWVRVYAPVGVTEKEEVQSISLTQNNVSFNVGDDPIDVYYSVNPSTAWDNNVNYESSNVNVATVYGSRITPVGVGTCKITARATNGVTATINVTVAQNTSINSTSIALNKNTLEIYTGTNSTLIATATPANHTDSILWKSSNTDVATVSNGVVTGKTKGVCTITAYSSANENVKAECSVTVKEAVQLTGHTTSGLTLQLDRNGMTSTTWKNKIDNVALQWKVANNNSTDIAPYMKFDGNSFYWEGANYKDHLTLDRFSNYYDFGESQTVILAGDFTNAKNPILSNKQKLSQNTSSAYINTNEVGYIGADGTKLGSINMTTQESGYSINGCIALRYNKQTLRVDADTMPFTANTPTNKNVVLSSAFSQGSYPALLGNISTAKIYFKVVLVYNRVLTDQEVQTAMRAIKTFLNS
ncbi:family 16 glycosylhydrolase [Romboutsia timonensis]|uniref:family 16 glycosylhydrolase n=1 Tax=Romboutsia timonensis TaxID=1776391 RepID=UPI0039965FE2